MLVVEDSRKQGGEKSVFLDLFVEEKVGKRWLPAYWLPCRRWQPSTIQLTLKKKDGATLDSTMVLAPMFFQGHMF
jgi:hypothetical protein